MTNKAGQNSKKQHSAELETSLDADSLKIKPLAATQKSEVHPFPQAPGQMPPSAMEQPLSQIANDRLLPEDDIHSFFKIRSSVGHDSFGFSFATKLFLGTIVTAMIFVCAYNYKRKFAVASDRIADRWLGVNPSQYIPAFGPRAKTKMSSGAINSARGGQKKPSSQNFPSDPLIPMIRNGQWSQVDQRITGKCVRWEATRDCALKGFYYAHRAMNQMTKPMLSVSDTSIGALEPQTKGLWHLAAALATTDANAREKRFEQAVRSIAPQDLSLRHILFDEMITGLYKSRQFHDLPRYMRLVDAEPKSRFTRSDLAKWRVLAGLTAPSNARPAIYKNALRDDQTSLRGDPQILILLTPEMIRSGQGSAFAELVSDANTNATASAIDKELYRGLMQSSVRLKYAQGQRTEYAALLAKYVGTFGKDPFSQHFNAVTQLNIGSDERNRNALNELRGMKTNAPWETWVIYAFALLRTGQPAKIDSMISVLGSRSQPPEIQMWGTILKSEKLLALKHAKEAEQAVKGLFAAMPNHSAVVDLMMRIYQAENRIPESSALRIKLDDLKAKTSYWSSPEMLRSPFGPLALVK